MSLRIIYDNIHSSSRYNRRKFGLDIKSPQKKVFINNMVEFYLNDKDKSINKKTNYLCNEKEKICVCNTHADDFRKIYDGINYEENVTYISWCKKLNDKF